MKLPKLLLCYCSLIFLFSCNTNDAKSWDDYVRESEKETKQRIVELKKQIGDSLTQKEIDDLKLKEIKKISILERDFINSVKDFDKENNENFYGTIKTICSINNCTYFEEPYMVSQRY